MWVILLAAVAAPVPRPLEIAVYKDCTWAIWNYEAYCPVLVPTDTELLCCEATLKDPGKLKLQQCATSATADTCPFLVTIRADAPSSWCCNFAAADALQEYIYPWGDDDFLGDGVAHE